MKKIITYLYIIICLSSCNDKNQKNDVSLKPNLIVTSGYEIPKDSLPNPEFKIIGLPEIIKSKSPNILPTNWNIKNIGILPVVNLRVSTKITMGQDTFKMAEPSPIKGKVVMARAPKVTIAKDMVSSDQNNSNFSYYGDLQGLENNYISCLLKDGRGNIWFGNDAGITKYDGKYFSSFSEKEGLISNNVNCIHEDRNGRIWIGTNDGLSCFDGKFFTNYTKNNVLSSNCIVTIYEDSKGNLWFGTAGTGVTCFNGKSFLNYTRNQGLLTYYISGITEDSKGNIWLASMGEGLFCFDGKSFINYSETEAMEFGGNNVVTSLCTDKKGTLWIGTQGGGILNLNGGIFNRYSEKEGLIGNMIKCIYQEKSGIINFGTEGAGFSQLNNNIITNYTEKEGLPFSYINQIIEDNSKNLWLATDGGLVSYQGKSYKYFTEKEGLINNSVTDIIEDKKGSLWFSTFSGVSKYNRSYFENYTTKEGLLSNSVNSILQDKKNNIWFGTWYNGLSCFDGTSFINYSCSKNSAPYYITSLIEDKKGQIWCGTSGGLTCFNGKEFIYYGLQKGYVNFSVQSLIEDSKGNIWAGTNGKGLYKYNGKTFKQFSIKEGLPNNIIYSVFEDISGNIWCGTYGNGVYRYDGKSFLNLTEKDGLVNNFVLSITQDKEGNIWLGTRKGISKLTKKHIDNLIGEKTNNANANLNLIKEKLFYNYTYNDGFLGWSCKPNSNIVDSNGNIWWGTNKLSFYNSNTSYNDTSAPNVEITNIKLYNENINWINLGAIISDSLGNEIKKGVINDTTLSNGVKISNIQYDGITKWNFLPINLSLPYYNNNVSFNFIGTQIQNRNHIKYQYILEGVDHFWSTITDKTEISFGNLTYGDYVFKVKAMNQNGIWSNPKEFKFEIRAPWWQTWYFRIILLLFIIGIVYTYIKNREIKLVAEKEKLEKTVEERTQEVVKEKIIVEEQKHLIEEKHKEITDSINYAERIQRSFLATKEQLDNNLIDYFVFFQPKDVVSGDFYWASKLKNGNFALVTADSTGHGVPGAIMSILNISSLEKAVEQGISEPSEILNHTRKTIIDRLKKDGSGDGGKDGMDCSLISFDNTKSKLIYSAANNPIWIVRDNEIIVLTPDKIPVGKHDKDSISFTQSEFEISKGDMIYTLTDGFPDQFGGPNGKKFMYKKLKDLLISISNKKPFEQKEVLTNILKDWMGNIEQVDDITIIGIRI